MDQQMIMILLLIAVMYFFMIRPQLKRQKLERKFQAEIGKGSNVVMTSGIHGKIVEVNTTDNTIMLETKAGKIKFERSAISMEMSKKYQKEAEVAKK